MFGFRALAALAAMSAALFGAGAAAAQSTYTFTPPGTYTTVQPDVTPGCSIAPCADYTGAMSVTGSFTTIAPLPPGFSGNAYPLVQNFVFNDGLTTYASTDPQVRARFFDITTDGTGAITSFNVVIQRWRTATPAVGSGGVDNRLDMVQMTAAVTAGENEIECAFAIGASPGAGVPGSCNGWQGSLDYTYGANFGAPGSFGAPVTIPTLSEWAMILFGLLLAGGAMVTIRRRRPA